MLDLVWLHLVTLQTIIVNSTNSCWMNQTAGPDMFQNCGGAKDYLTMVLTGWQWVTGGWFSMILVSIFVAFSYIKYHKAIYPLIVGTLFLPIGWFLFPTQFLTFAFIFGGVVVAILIHYIFISQTNEA